MELKDWLTVAGWLVTFGLGIVSGGFIMPRLTRKRTLLRWALVSESEIVPRQLTEMLGLPVVLTVGDANPGSLSIVTVRLGGAGNEVLTDISVLVSFNRDARILNARPVDSMGEYGRSIRWEPQDHTCRINADFINPGQRFDFEFLLSDYDTGTVDVDSAAPGLQLNRQDPTKWEVPTTALRGFALSIFGIRYEPSAISLSQIAEELRATRKYLSGRSTSHGEALSPNASKECFPRTQAESDIIRYMHGVDGDWVSIETLASYSKTESQITREFLDRLFACNIVAKKNEGGKDVYRLIEISMGA